MKKPEISTCPPLCLAGIRKNMSLQQDGTLDLWKTFMPLRNQIRGRLGSDFYSVQEYPSDYFARFDPSLRFNRWAAVPVASRLEVLPSPLEFLDIPAGQYAVFQFQGSVDQAMPFFQFIFSEWIPNSDFETDLRPHFEILPEGYNPADPNAREQIWIPIRPRGI